MKRAFILPGLALVLFACNNNSDRTAANEGTPNHSGHHSTTDNSKNQDSMKTIEETMSKMMHDMHAAKPTGNNDIDFATMMVAHHRGAVEMSKVEVDNGNNAELKAFAQKVIDDQNKEIDLMQTFISKAAKTGSLNSKEFQKALNQSMSAMMNGNTPSYNDIDKDFAAQMIPHHQSAVDMANGYLEFGKEARLVTLCQNIINSQTKEINFLKEWLVNNGK